MKVRKRVGRGKAARVVERPVRVHQHCNDWATVDYLDEEGGHGAVSVLALVMETEADLMVFQPVLVSNGTLWDEFKLRVRGDKTWEFIRKPEEEVRQQREIRRQR